jgi:signal transduction histidine kinase
VEIIGKIDASANEHLPTYNSKKRLFSNSPFRLLLLIMCAVFVGETTVMIILAFMPDSPVWSEALFDSAMLVVLLFPVLYFFIFRPFVHQIDYLNKAEQAVRESEVRFKQIFEGSPIGIAAYDNDGCLLKSNKAYLDIFGISDDTEINCLNLFEFPNITDEIKGKIRNGKMVRFEAAFDLKKAENLKCFKSEKSAVLHLDFIISPLGRQMPDALLGYLLQIRDITKKKLMERQLIRSEKLASLGCLVSGIAHEINNPNTFISFNVPILREYFQEILPMLDDYAKDHPDIEISGMPYEDFRKDIFNLLDNLEHGSSRISQIISGLKEFSRGQDEIDLVDVDLNQVISRVISNCRNEINSAVKSFNVDISPKLPLIKSDPKIVEQVLVNLLINAAQAVDKKDSWVRLNVALGSSWSDQLMIEVSDNGSGMNEETIKKIFDPFFTTKSPGKGTGLGLTISHNLIEQIGGRIEVESEPNKGSTFKLILNKRSS